MSGIYIHIPFCKQACHYCDFHFSTSMAKRERMVLALADEIRLRRDEAETIGTIYFGGGTPSVLTDAEILYLIKSVRENYKVLPDAEITLEANPDDLLPERFDALRQTGINRLSIGIQSFFDDDLRLMNRAHDAGQALRTLNAAVQFFDNISIDLIYGIPGLSNERWKANIDYALASGVPHISSYALTVEPRTVLHKMVLDRRIAEPSEESAAQHFQILTDTLTQNGFLHYELSNFAKPGYFSKNNSAYWLGTKYIGIGPSAHSYDGMSRSWNIANNAAYLKGIESGNRNFEMETLSPVDRYNESVMTGLRTIWGVSLERIKVHFGDGMLDFMLSRAERFITAGLLEVENGALRTTEKGKFLADGIASDLFLVNLDT